MLELVNHGNLSVQETFFGGLYGLNGGGRLRF